METQKFIHYSAVTSRWFWGAGLIWTIMIAVSLGWHLHTHDQELQFHSLAEANATIDDLIVVRAWNASHGGVYVKTSNTVQPNPYLKSLVKERDVVTESGVKLTLINPAYMTRQLNDLLAKKNGRLAHITSLKPLRPENAPDAWEASALQSFEHGATDYFEITEMNGMPYMRAMRPLLTKKDCLQCHAQQGYKEGDIRGGISAAVPLQEHLALLKLHHFQSGISYGLIWLLGLAGIRMSRRKIANSQQNNLHAEKKLIDSEKRYRELYENSPLGYQSLGKDGCFIEANPSLCWMLGYPHNEIVGKPFANFLTPESAEKFSNNFPKFKEKGEVHAVAFDMVAKDGHIFSVEIDGRVAYNDLGEFKQTHCVVQDVTLRKKVEIDLQQLNSKLEQLSFLDELTGISNRRMLDLMLDKEWGRSMREKHSLSLLMIDIDFFKQYNDSYGHLQGDKCLTRVAQVLSGVSKRAADLCARYGGEEFVLLLPNTDAKQALYLAEVCREKVIELYIPHGPSSVGDFVTISVGVATLMPVEGTSPLSLIEVADAGLYLAKNGGRNRVESKQIDS